MRSIPRAALAASLAMCSLACVASASAVSYRLSGGARFHSDNDDVGDWPYEKGDMSYGLGFAIYEGIGYIEVGCDYMPESDSDDSPVDSAVEPRLRVAVRDGVFVAGTGISCPYVWYADGATERRDDGTTRTMKDDWTDLMYQLYLGLEFPLGPITLDGGASYSFEDWDGIKDFDTKDLEYEVRMGFAF